VAVSEIDPRPAEAPCRPALVTLAAVDLADSPKYRGLWFPGVDHEGSPPEGLPPDGFPSPMGYWLHPVDGGAEARGAFPLTVRDKPGGQPLAGVAGGPARASRVVTLGSPDSAVGTLTLTIGGSSPTEVVASPAAWAKYSEAVLLVVAQYARLQAIDDALVDVYAMYRSQDFALPGLWRWLSQRPVLAEADTFCQLVYDWNHFTGLYVDPAHYSRMSRSISAYWHLADGLGIPQWCKRLEATIEDIEEGYDNLLDKLFHYRLFALGMVVEFVIVVMIGCLLMG
jgi:hypothetical protein